MNSKEQKTFTLDADFWYIYLFAIIFLILIKLE